PLAPGLAGSARAAIGLGLPGATAISKWLPAKTEGDPSTSSASTIFCMFGSSAEAKTSAGAPFVICVARVDDDPKLNEMSAPGTRPSNTAPALGNASVSA